MRQENRKNTAGLDKMQIIAIKCGKFGQKMQHVYKTSVQAFGENTNTLFLDTVTLQTMVQYVIFIKQFLKAS